MGFCEKFKKDFEQVGCDTFIVPEGYRTPATDYPLDSYRSAKLTRSHYEKDSIRLMEGVRGKDFFCTKEETPVTDLKILSKSQIYETWMVDDPLHWEGMQALAEKSEGNVLLAGLGLGLLPHALRKNPKVKKIDIYEFNEDVIALMKDKIPKDVKIHNRNIYDYSTKRIHRIFAKKKPLACHDTIILDIWAGPGSERIKEEMEFAVSHFRIACPESKIYVWGTNNQMLNPAVEKQPCEAADRIKTETQKRRGGY
jgi:hypothetical protein